MISKAELDFLSELALNNNRDWFNDNKKRFEKHQEMILKDPALMNVQSAK